jgi:7-carboxy-7-deazaguanine synthase
MNQAGMKAVLKFVVANDQDFAFAVDVASHYPHVDTYVQPITITDKVGHEKRAFPTYRRLCERVATTPALSHWRVIPQLHVLAWGGERGR